MSTWETKVHKRIAELARAAWIQNKKRPGYRIPLEAEILVEALGENDEEKCKAILLFGLLGDPTPGARHG